MIIRGVSLEVGERAALEIGVRLENVRPRRNGFDCTLRPILESGKWYRTTRSWHKGRRRRRIAAVCYHGHYAWMARLFQANPEAKIVTKLARYDGLGDFKYRAGLVGENNIQNNYDPLEYSAACICLVWDAEWATKELPATTCQCRLCNRCDGLTICARCQRCARCDGHSAGCLGCPALA